MGCSVSAEHLSGYKGNAKPPSLKLKNISIEDEPAHDGNVVFDPRLPLTVRQRFHITKSWKAIARNMESTGILMFLRLFETNTEVRTMFSKITRGKDTSEVRESKELENHVKMVMYTLDEAISSLQDADEVIQMLHSVGRSHLKNLNGFDPVIFWQIEEPFLLAVKETLGERYTTNMEYIYRKTIKFILETLQAGFREAEQFKGD